MGDERRAVNKAVGGRSVARAERPLDAGEGPLLRLAGDLRKLREKAGGPAYRELSRRAHFSTGALSDAAGGRKLPSLAVTLAYVGACGGDVVEWEQRWHEVSAELAVSEPVALQDGAPYLGLSAFGPEDGDRFFGRERLVEQLCARVADERFVVVIGPSGSGKSSVLRAGLLPGTAGQAVVLTPGARPLQELAARSAALVGGTASALHTALRTDVDALHLTALQTDGADVLVVVDQFEEVFTLCRDPAERERFLAVLFAAARASNSRCRVVLGVRADFYAHCAQHRDLVAVLRTAQVLVGPMTTEELRSAITRPAVEAGYQVEAALVSKVIADATGEPGVLPLVSHALLETWRRRRGITLSAAGYEAAGGIDQAIARTASAVYAELSPEQQRWTRQLFLRLVALGEGTEDTKRRLDVAEFELDPFVVERLAAARLVTLDRSSVQIGHEALIRCWPLLRQWLAEDREGLRLHRQLTEATGVWESLDRDPGALYRGTRLALARDLTGLSSREQEFLTAGLDLEAAEQAAVRRRARRLRSLVAGLVVLLMLTTAATVYAVRASKEVTTQRNAALAHKVAGEALALRTANLPLAAQLGLAAHRLVPGPETRDALVGILAVAVPGHTQAVTSATFLSGRLVTAGHDGTVRLWDLAAKPPAELVVAGGLGPIASLALSPDGRTAATAGFDRSVRLWDLQSRTELAVLKGHTDVVYSVAFSPDGRLLASGSYDHTARLWDVAGRQPLATLTGHALNVKPVAFSPDGRLLATGSDDRTVRLWDVATRAEVAVLTGHTDLVAALAFSPNGRTLASGGDDRTVRLWDVDARAGARVLAGHTNVVASLAFSPDGRTLASGGYDHTIRQWDPATGASTATLTGHTGEVVSVAYSPDGRTLASASDDRTAQLWDTDAGRAEARACEVAEPAITQEEWSRYFPDVPYTAPCP
jgi:WD40 repeat protein/energy-coupling factor transporter ATP-binding protein EcfA2